MDQGALWATVHETKEMSYINTHICGIWKMVQRNLLSGQEEKYSCREWTLWTRQRKARVKN